jgi:L-lactate utilization protein LutC
VITCAIRVRSVGLLLPKEHLTVLRAADLCSDLAVISACLQVQPNGVSISGSSRTAGNGLTMTFRVHGPRVLHVKALED